MMEKIPFIENIISAHVMEYVFPGETAHTPDFVTMARADKMAWMLRERLTQLHTQGIDVSLLSVKELLGMHPDEIELTEEDFC
jgi:hypothetical protein